MESFMNLQELLQYINLYNAIHNPKPSWGLFWVDLLARGSKLLCSYSQTQNTQRELTEEEGKLNLAQEQRDLMSYCITTLDTTSPIHHANDDATIHITSPLGQISALETEEYEKIKETTDTYLHLTFTPKAQDKAQIDVDINALVNAILGMSRPIGQDWDPIQELQTYKELIDYASAKCPAYTLLNWLYKNRFMKSKLEEKSVDNWELLRGLESGMLKKCKVSDEFKKIALRQDLFLELGLGHLQNDTALLEILENATKLTKDDPSALDALEDMSHIYDNSIDVMICNMGDKQASHKTVHKDLFDKLEPLIAHLRKQDHVQTITGLKALLQKFCYAESLDIEKQQEIEACKPYMLALFNSEKLRDQLAEARKKGKQKPEAPNHNSLYEILNTSDRPNNPKIDEDLDGDNLTTILNQMEGWLLIQLEMKKINQHEDRVLSLHDFHQMLVADATEDYTFDDISNAIRRDDEHSGRDEHNSNLYGEQNLIHNKVTKDSTEEPPPIKVDELLKELGLNPHKEDDQKKLQKTASNNPLCPTKTGDFLTVASALDRDTLEAVLNTEGAKLDIERQNTAGADHALITEMEKALGPWIDLKSDEGHGFEKKDLADGISVVRAIAHHQQDLSQNVLYSLGDTSFMAVLWKAWDDDLPTLPPRDSTSDINLKELLGEEFFNQLCDFNGSCNEDQLKKIKGQLLNLSLENQRKLYNKLNEWAKLRFEEILKSGREPDPQTCAFLTAPASSGFQIPRHLAEGLRHNIDPPAEQGDYLNTAQRAWQMIRDVLEYNDAGKLVAYDIFNPVETSHQIKVRVMSDSSEAANAVLRIIGYKITEQAFNRPAPVVDYPDFEDDLGLAHERRPETPAPKARQLDEGLLKVCIKPNEVGVTNPCAPFNLASVVLTDEGKLTISDPEKNSQDHAALPEEPCYCYNPEEHNDDEAVSLAFKTSPSNLSLRPDLIGKEGSYITAITIKGKNITKDLVQLQKHMCVLDLEIERCELDTKTLKEIAGHLEEMIVKEGENVTIPFDDEHIAIHKKHIEIQKYDLNLYFVNMCVFIWHIMVGLTFIALELIPPITKYATEPENLRSIGWILPSLNILSAFISWSNIGFPKSEHCNRFLNFVLNLLWLATICLDPQIKKMRYWEQTYGNSLLNNYNAIQYRIMVCLVVCVNFSWNFGIISMPCTKEEASIENADLPGEHLSIEILNDFNMIKSKIEETEAKLEALKRSELTHRALQKTLSLALEQSNHQTEGHVITTPRASQIDPLTLASPTKFFIGNEEIQKEGNNLAISTRYANLSTAAMTDISKLIQLGNKAVTEANERDKCEQEYKNEVMNAHLSNIKDYLVKYDEIIQNLATQKISVSALKDNYSENIKSLGLYSKNPKLERIEGFHFRTIQGVKDALDTIPVEYKALATLELDKIQDKLQPILDHAEKERPWPLDPTAPASVAIYLMCAHDKDYGPFADQLDNIKFEKTDCCTCFNTCCNFLSSHVTSELEEQLLDSKPSPFSFVVYLDGLNILTTREQMRQAGSVFDNKGKEYDGGTLATEALKNHKNLRENYLILFINKDTTIDELDAQIYDQTDYLNDYLTTSTTAKPTDKRKIMCYIQQAANTQLDNGSIRKFKQLFKDFSTSLNLGRLSLILNLTTDQVDHLNTALADVPEGERAFDLESWEEEEYNKSSPERDNFLRNAKKFDDVSKNDVSKKIKMVLPEGMDPKEVKLEECNSYNDPGIASLRAEQGMPTPRASFADAPRSRSPSLRNESSRGSGLADPDITLFPHGAGRRPLTISRETEPAP